MDSYSSPIFNMDEYSSMDAQAVDYLVKEASEQASDVNLTPVHTPEPQVYMHRFHKDETDCESRPMSLNYGRQKRAKLLPSALPIFDDPEPVQSDAAFWRSLAACAPMEPEASYRRYYSFGADYQALDSKYNAEQKCKLDAMSAMDRAVFIQFEWFGVTTKVYQTLVTHGVSWPWACQLHERCCKQLGVWHSKDEFILGLTLVADEAGRLQRVREAMAGTYGTCVWSDEELAKRVRLWSINHRFGSPVGSELYNAN